MNPRIIKWKLDPAAIFRDLSMLPDSWQADVLRSTDTRIILLCSRQTGKSTVCAVMALHQALCRPKSLVLMFSPSLRQSTEIFSKTTGFYHDLGEPVPFSRKTETKLVLSNKSRIISLPGSHETIRGYSAPDLILVDEAAMVDDSLFVGVSPMLATSRGGRIVLISTPFGRRGFFHDQYESGAGPWSRVVVKAEQCPRISAEFLEEQRQLLGDRWFRQEHCCSFEETIDQVFDTESVMRMQVLNPRDKDLQVVRF